MLCLYCFYYIIDYICSENSTMFVTKRNTRSNRDVKYCANNKKIEQTKKRNIYWNEHVIVKYVKK